MATRALADLMHDIMASGRKPIDTPDITDEIAVHELRKTFKRWRAILRLIGPAIGDEAEVLRIEARDLARQIASARDGRAALEALADLGEDPPGLSPRSRATITERLSQIGASAEAASLTPMLKARISEALARAANAIDRWPIERFDSTEATRQLTATYRRVRDAMPEDWSAASPEHLHRLRQRVVEHRYQMELVDPLWPKLMRVWVAEAQRLRDRLGSHQDLAVLQRLASPHQPLAYWRSRLTPLIAERQADHVQTAKRLAGRLFAEKPKAFRQRLASLWKHRTDGRD
jgi:CHAD domain-containing protein